MALGKQLHLSGVLKVSSVESPPLALPDAT
jgi:hypothetical protein